MSVAFYKNDHTPLCVNHLDTGYLAEQNIFNGNYLNIFPEQSNEIYRRCFNYLATCKLSSRCVRIFCVIMEQTIGFHKLEDNVTSTRLEKLSKIRRDHAAQAMHELSRNNVIIHRHGGQYRNFVSINFNLDSWGAGQTNSHARSNDPRLLISDAYEGQAIDEGLDLSVVNEPESEFTAHFEPPINVPEDPIDQGYDLAKTHPEASIKQGHTSENKPHPKACKPAPVEIQESQVASKTSETKQAQITPEISETKQAQITPEISATKTLSPQSEKVIDEDTLSLKIQNAVASALNSIEKKVTHLAKQLHSVEEKVQTVKIEANTSVSNPQTPLNNTELNPQTPSNNAETTSYATTNPAFEYQFPIQLSTQQCQELERSLLPRAGDYSQALLDTLGKRLLNSTDPLKNPMAYISSLVSKLETGTLDVQSFLSNTERAAREKAKITQQKAEKHEQLQQQIDQLTQDYLAEYEVYKPTHAKIEQAAKETSLNYQEAAKKLELFETITPILNKLDRLLNEVKRLEVEQEKLMV